jgi:carbonic anhydrase
MDPIDELLEANRRFARGFSSPARSGQPRRRVAIVACMDARLDVAAAFGLEPGDAHVIRNAGGIVTDDVLRSLVVSQRLLGTEHVLLVHHTDCGMTKVMDEQLADELERATGVRPPFAFGGFPDVEASLRASRAKLLASPFLACRSVRAVVYDVATGRASEVR